MGSKKRYWCNTCGTNYDERKEALENLLGLNFSGMRKFKLGTIDETDGYHICIWCAGQISEQAPALLKGKVVIAASGER